MGSALSSYFIALADHSLFDIREQTITLTDFLIFIAVLGLTFFFMKNLPYRLKKIIQSNIKKRHELELKDDIRKGETSLKREQYSQDIANQFERFSYWVILLLGLFLAFTGVGLDIHNPMVENVISISIYSILQFFGIILFTNLLSRVIPIWLVNVLERFVSLLKNLRSTGPDEEEKTVGKGKEEAEEKEGSEEEAEREKGEYTNLITAYFTKFLFWCIWIIGVAYAVAAIGFETNSEIVLFGNSLLVRNLVNALLSALITAIFVIHFLPPMLNIILTYSMRMYSRLHQKEDEKVIYLENEVEKMKPGLNRAILYLVVLFGLHTSLTYIRAEYDTNLLELVFMLVRGLIVLVAAFLFTILTPIFIYVVSSSVKGDFKKTNVYQIGRYFNFLILIIALFLMISVAGVDLRTEIYLGESEITGWSIISAVVVLVVAMMASKMIIAMMKDTVLHPDHMDKHAAAVLERMSHYLIVAIAISIALSVLGVNIVAVATGLGLIGFAIAFGMQDTIANFMAGIMIAVERPFKIGDRIRVGDEWGNVIDIGMRSTRISTVKHETVTIPNNLIATREVWNYTKENPSIIMTVPIGISYDSDWHAAEEIIIRVAKKHPFVLKKPEPEVRMIQFGESSIDLELWATISHAKYKETAKSDILKSVKDKFDKEGVEIPYPYRTIVFKKDLESEVKPFGVQQKLIRNKGVLNQKKSS